MREPAEGVLIIAPSHFADFPRSSLGKKLHQEKFYSHGAAAGGELDRFQRGDYSREDSGFFLHFAECGLLAFFARLDVTFRQNPFVFPPFRSNEQILETILPDSVNDAAGVSRAAISGLSNQWLRVGV